MYQYVPVLHIKYWEDKVALGLFVETENASFFLFSGRNTNESLGE